MHWLEFITCSWVVVIPWGSSNSTVPPKMELFIYPDLQVQQNVIGELFGSIMTWISLLKYIVFFVAKPIMKLYDNERDYHSVANMIPSMA